MTKKHFQEIKIEDKFLNFKNYLSLEEAINLIEDLINYDVLKFKTNTMVYRHHPESNRNIKLINSNKKRAGLCMHLTKLLYYLTGKGVIVCGNIKFFNGERSSHSVLKVDNFYFDMSLSQFETIGIDNIDYCSFKPIYENYIFGFKELRKNNFKSQKLSLICPSYQMINKFEEIIKFETKAYFLKYHLEMKNEFLTKIKNHN